MGIDLESGDIIFLDTVPFIYILEQHPEHVSDLEKLRAHLYGTSARSGSPVRCIGDSL